MLSLFPGGWDEANLLWLGGLGRLALGLFGAAALAVLVLTWLDARALRGGRAALVTGLRALVLLTGLGLLLEPAVELRSVSRVPNRVAIVVDTSASGALPGTADATRWALTQQAVAAWAPAWTAPTTDHVFAWYALSDTLQPTTPDALLAATPDGARTRILEGLEELPAPPDGRPHGAVILVSDGADNGSLVGRIDAAGRPDARVLALLDQLPGPIHTVANATQRALRDVAITQVRHDSFAFVRNAMQVEVAVQAYGYAGRPVTVSLLRNGVPLHSREVILADGEPVQTTLEFVPELLGREVYTVRVPVQEGEVVVRNNEAHFVVRVIRDRIRVLQVVGRPSWDVRFLRQYLKGNANVDLLSFFILRSSDDVQRAANSEMSLIPFPTDDLFERELGSFDLVIFQNFGFEPYDMRQYLDNVRDYVNNGGGFAMVGGDQSFSLGGYAGTEIEQIVPVALPPGRDPRALVAPAPFVPVLTDAGDRHPLTRLLFDPAANRALWEGLPPSRGSNRVGAATPDATVLAVHPSEVVAGTPMPVLTVADRGRGRVLALTVEDAWRWSFDAVRAQGSSRAYADFWNAAIRWLIRDPALNLVHVEVAEPTLVPGQTLEALVRALQVDYAPAPGATGTARIWRRPLDAEVAATETLVAEVPLVMDARGRMVVSHVVDEEGAWRIEAVVDIPQAGETSAQDLALVEQPRRELAQVQPNTALLQALAAASGGRHETLPGVRPVDLPLPPATVERVDRREVIDLWNHPLVLLWLALLLGLEWTLRRRFGLP